MSTEPMERLDSPEPPLAERPVVLFCEAYDGIREGLRLVLGDHFQVTAVCQIDALWPLLQKTTPDLLLIDVDDQPTARAYEVLPELRRVCPSTPVLLLARAFSLQEQERALQRVGNVGFLTKPWSNELLVEKAWTLIRGYSTSPIRRRVVRIAS